jgi:hypothetical protein
MLDGLKSYRKKSGEVFSQLPPRERVIARQLLNKYAHRHGPRLSQQKQALLKACAASNSRRVGNKSWSRSMRRRKGLLV